MSTSFNPVRIRLYDTLAALFIRPETDGILDDYEEALTLSASLLEELGLNADKLAALIGKAHPENLALQAEYARLFLGVGEQTTSLCESTWTSAKGLLCQSAQFECRSAYLQAGLAITDELCVPEDHLGMMLGFMSVLYLKDENDTARHFFNEHLAVFLPVFSDAILKRDDALFFKDVAWLLKSLVEIEALIAQKAQN